jgi:hypothetical protein
VAKDSFSLWLNQHPAAGEKIAEVIILSAQKRLKSSKKAIRKKISAGPQSMLGKGESKQLMLARYICFLYFILLCHSSYRGRGAVVVVIVYDSWIYNYICNQ